MIHWNFNHFVVPDGFKGGKAKRVLKFAKMNRYIGMISPKITNRINTQMNISVQAAVMARIMSLPAGFFKDYSSGELAELVEQQRVDV